MPVSRETYERVALEDEGCWELIDGKLREKLGASAIHNDIVSEVAFALGRQLSREDYVIRGNSGRLRIGDHTFIVPDAFVIERQAARHLKPDELESYAEPAALVVEVWAPPSETYNDDLKLTIYEERRDREIWLVNPANRSVAVRTLRADGEYHLSRVTDRDLRPRALPGVSIDVATLFSRS